MYGVQYVRHWYVAVTRALFQPSLQPGTLKNYGSNLAGFFGFCELHAIALLDVSPVDIARYIACNCYATNNM